MSGWMRCGSKVAIPSASSSFVASTSRGKMVMPRRRKTPSAVVVNKTSGLNCLITSSSSPSFSYRSMSSAIVSMKNSTNATNIRKKNFLLCKNHKKATTTTTAITRPHRTEYRTNQRHLSSSSSKSLSDGAAVDAKFDRPEYLAKQLVEVSERPGAIENWIKDLNAIQRSELASLMAKASVPEASTYVIPEPTRRDLKLVVFTTSIPFVGFGIMDNSILIIAGDAIDTSLGVAFGISTMCAAAIGNIISDVAGIGLGTVVEDFCAMYLNLPVPNITTAQRQLRSVRYANQLGCGIGIVIGCIIGMFPLLWIDSKKVQHKKREAQMDSIFKDIVTQAKTLIGASRVCLYLRVNDQNNPIPVPDGKYLYFKYDAASAHRTTASASNLEGGLINRSNTQHNKPNQVASASSSDSAVKKQERFIPVGRGIVSRALLTGETWNIVDAQSEPDFAPDLGYEYWEDATLNAGRKTKTMVVVPICDAQGTPFAVIQAVNKISKGREDIDHDPKKDHTVPNVSSENVQRFTESDVQMIKALAGHIGVTLQRMYDETAEDEEVRLRDTIKILKDYGLAGINPDDGGEDQSGSGKGKRSSKIYSSQPLFPEH